MTLEEIKSQVMFQVNTDEEDLEDYEPHVSDYINEGYDRLVHGYAGVHVAAGTEYTPLKDLKEEPKLPLYAHRALADYATYMIYRNGNAVKQNRGMAFYGAFSEVESRLMGEQVRANDSASGKHKFRNIYS